MKAPKAHNVRLSNETLRLLAQKLLGSNSEYVSPNRIKHDEPLNPQKTNAASV
ncbi:hypothetical protein [Gilliamella sp. HK7]|uniref:hypothetical protein n=1 Tax=Gilliamella sp. HK7 TaxID=3120247 RepID=UPI001C3FFB6A|nr:hypothetical protein [Gilliamella apicola]